ncbi:Hypothetical predicted protein, partial [Cloeon dipterum]
RWRTGGLKEDQEQRRPRRRTERINEAQQPLAKTRSDAEAVAEEVAAAEEEAAAAVAEVETVAAERTALTSEWAASSAVRGSREGCHGSGEQREDAGGGSEGRGRRGGGEPCPCPVAGNAGGAGHRGENQHDELVHTRPAME